MSSLISPKNGRVFCLTHTIHLWYIYLHEWLIFIWVVATQIFFNPYLGKISILTNIFQRGWNHQLVMVFITGRLYPSSQMDGVLTAHPPNPPVETQGARWPLLTTAEAERIFLSSSVACIPTSPRRRCLLLKDAGHVVHQIWSNYSDLTRVFTPNGGFAREIPLFQGNLGWWNIIIWPDQSIFKKVFLTRGKCIYINISSILLMVKKSHSQPPGM